VSTPDPLFLPFLFRVRNRVRLFSRTLIDGHGLAFHVADAVKVDLGGEPVLTPQDSLDGAYRDVLLVHVLRAHVPADESEG
jgi:hypothetical protein